MLVQRLIDCGIAKLREISGCTEPEIRVVQDTTQLPLPKAYIDFLSTVGRGAGGFLRDVDIFYPKNLSLNSIAKDLLDDWEEGKLLLPNGAFVFSMRNGEQFLFFIADGKSDNPAVYHYMENTGHFKQIAMTFWDAIESELRISENFYQNSPYSPFNADFHGF